LPYAVAAKGVLPSAPIRFAKVSTI
jgi:hypothetical protein